MNNYLYINNFVADSITVNEQRTCTRERKKREREGGSVIEGCGGL